MPLELVVPAVLELLLPGFSRPLHRQSFRTMGLLENRAIEGGALFGAVT